MKIQTLPQGEERLQRLKQSLPLFSTAQDEDFKDTFAMLRDYARLSVPFSLLMALSAMLATLGLFLNSTPRGYWRHGVGALDGPPCLPRHGYFA